MKESNINEQKELEGIEKEIEKKEKTNSKKDLLSLINNLVDFESDLKSLKSVNDILSKSYFDFLKKLSLKNNIRINLLLSKIYMSIITNESLYNEYIISINDYEYYKIDILLQLIENCVLIVEKLKYFVFSSELHQLKKKIIELLKCIYFNYKNKFKEEENLQKIYELKESLPSKFFSESFIELNKNKELYKVYKTQEIKKIKDFIEKFSEINNYYEQLEVFKKFVENNSGVVNCSSIDEESLDKITEFEITENLATKDKIAFYEEYGSLLLKLCNYHKYMFLDNEEKENENNQTDKEEIENKEEEDKNIRMVFLLNKTKQNKKEDNNDKNIKKELLLKDKQFISILDSKEYKELIKKEIYNYFKTTKNIENEQKIKTVRALLTYYLNKEDIDSYYPLYLRDITKININDGFSRSYLTNVPAGETKKFYFETNADEDTLIYIEFYLEDATKNINFELNSFDNNKNKFISVFKEEKIENTFKFLMLSHGYCIYEMVFDNKFSWFNSKDINYKISLLKYIDKKIDESQYLYTINGKNFYLNKDEISNHKKIKNDKNIINVPVIFHLNNLKIVSFKENENKENEIIIKEHIEENESIIPRYLFNYLLNNHLKKLKIGKDKKTKIIISIFSQNRDLLTLDKEIIKQIKPTDNNEELNYIKNIGFFPNKLEDYDVEYKLYDTFEQILIYHISLSITEDIINGKSFLLIELDKLMANASIYDKGKILNKLEDFKFNNINIEDIDAILLLIKKVNDAYEETELILSINDDIDEENLKKQKDIIEKIKKYCQEIINPPLKIYEYKQKDICINVIKYTNLFY